MPNGIIEILRDDVQIIEFLWTGTRAKGDAMLRLTDDDESDTLRNLRKAIADRRDLARVRFTTDRASVTGWRGFDGHLAGLLVVLPALGLDIGAVVWPDQTEMV